MQRSPGLSIPYRYFSCPGHICGYDLTSLGWQESLDERVTESRDQNISADVPGVICLSPSKVPTRKFLMSFYLSSFPSPTSTHGSAYLFPLVHHLSGQLSQPVQVALSCPLLCVCVGGACIIFLFSMLEQLLLCSHDSFHTCLPDWATEFHTQSLSFLFSDVSHFSRKRKAHTFFGICSYVKSGCIHCLLL